MSPVTAEGSERDEPVLDDWDREAAPDTEPVAGAREDERSEKVGLDLERVVGVVARAADDRLLGARLTFRLSQSLGVRTSPGRATGRRRRRPGGRSPHERVKS